MVPYKKALAGVICLFFALTANAQLPSTEHFEKLYDNGEYDKVIAEIPKKTDDLEAMALYYIGMAYYFKESDDNAMKFFDLAIAKGPAHHDMYFYKGKLHYYAGDYKKAMPLFDKAIEMYADEPDFYIAKGDVYRKTGKEKLAIPMYEKAIHFTHCNNDGFTSLAGIYVDAHNDSAALRVYKAGLLQMEPEEEDYKLFSYNVGLLQALTGDSLAAKNSFESHVKAFPDDYKAVAKLIQAYYNFGEYDKATPLKDVIYKAHDNGKLPDYMNKMFCFDQFKWNGRRVMAYEHYGFPDEKNGDIFVKHGFYIMDEKGEIDFKIESESSDAVRMNKGDLYVLCEVKDGSHHTYWDYVFNNEYHYPDLKKAVINILNKSVKPAASFTPSKKGGTIEIDR